MSTRKSIPAVVKTASVLTVFAAVGAACSQDAPDAAYNEPATTPPAAETPMAEDRTTDSYTATNPAQTAGNYDSSNAPNAQAAVAAAKETAAKFGVDELDDIENWKITNNGEELGEIDRIGIDRSTGELLAVVGLEGVVGVNMKEVGVPLKQLNMAGDDTLSTNLTKDELQQQRDIDPWDGQVSDDALEDADMD